MTADPDGGLIGPQVGVIEDNDLLKLNGRQGELPLDLAAVEQVPPGQLHHVDCAAQVCAGCINSLVPERLEILHIALDYWEPWRKTAFSKLLSSALTDQL